METDYGPFSVFAFEFDPQSVHLALLTPDGTQWNQPDVVPLLRVQSHCLTSTAFRSTMCDCAEQIQMSLHRLSDAPPGIMLYLDQEARGHGLVNKIRVMRFLNQGMQLVDAQAAANVAEDLRQYHHCLPMLRHIGCDQPVDLLTDSPQREVQLSQCGLRVRHVVPLKEEMEDA